MNGSRRERILELACFFIREIQPRAPSGRIAERGAYDNLNFG